MLCVGSSVSLIPYFARKSGQSFLWSTLVHFSSYTVFVEFLLAFVQSGFAQLALVCRVDLVSACVGASFPRVGVVVVAAAAAAAAAALVVVTATTAATATIYVKTMRRRIIMIMIMLRNDAHDDEETTTPTTTKTHNYEDECHHYSYQK